MIELGGEVGYVVNQEEIFNTPGRVHGNNDQEEQITTPSAREHRNNYIVAIPYQQNPGIEQGLPITYCLTE